MFSRGILRPVPFRTVLYRKIPYCILLFLFYYDANNIGKKIKATGNKHKHNSNINLTTKQHYHKKGTQRREKTSAYTSLTAIPSISWLAVT